MANLKLHREDRISSAHELFTCSMKQEDKEIVPYPVPHIAVAQVQAPQILHGQPHYPGLFHLLANRAYHVEWTEFTQQHGEQCNSVN